MANINLSNGTCYFAPHSETHGDFIPCGNIALGHWPCCKIGSVCLGFETANACYDYDSGNTYVAGCTDPTYGDSTCLGKLGFGDQEWVAIHHCGTTSSGDQNWGGCKNDPANDTVLTQLADSMCDYCAGTTLWVGSASIEAYATVPTSAGGSITWTNDFNPATTTRTFASPTGTTTGLSTGTDTSGASSQTSTSPASTDSTDSRGLDIGAKVGIGIGSVCAAGLLIIAIIMISRQRRSRQDTPRGQQHSSAQAVSQTQLSMVDNDHTLVSNAATLMPGQINGSGSYGIPRYNDRHGPSGLVSEMPGQRDGSGSHTLPPYVEIAGDPRYNDRHGQSGLISGMPGQIDGSGSYVLSQSLGVAGNPREINHHRGQSG